MAKSGSFLGDISVSVYVVPYVWEDEPDVHEGCYACAVGAELLD